MAGRNISVAHYALGTAGVQEQTSMTGQAAGTTPRGVYVLQPPH